MGRGIAIALCRAGYDVILVENDEKVRCILSSNLLPSIISVEKMRFITWIHVWRFFIYRHWPSARKNWASLSRGRRSSRGFDFDFPLLSSMVIKSPAVVPHAHIHKFISYFFRFKAKDIERLTSSSLKLTTRLEDLAACQLVSLCFLHVLHSQSVHLTYGQRDWT